MSRYQEVPTIPMPLEPLRARQEVAPTSRKSLAFNLVAGLAVMGLVMGSDMGSGRLLHDIGLGLLVCAGLALLSRVWRNR